MTAGNGVVREPCARARQRGPRCRNVEKKLPQWHVHCARKLILQLKAIAFDDGDARTTVSDHASCPKTHCDFRRLCAPPRALRYSIDVTVGTARKGHFTSGNLMKFSDSGSSVVSIATMDKLTV